MSYYSNIVSVTQSNVVSNVTVVEYSNLSVDDQANYLECNYYSSNSAGYYSNLMVYDGINVFSNITSNAYNALKLNSHQFSHDSMFSRVHSPDFIEIS